MGEWFHRFAVKIAEMTGTPGVFVLAIVIIAIWGLSGPMFGYSDTWQLVINTGTTIVTFLMVFLIQNTQNRDAKAIHLKLDELLRSVEGARTSLVDLEEDSDEDLEALRKEFQELHKRFSAEIGHPPAPEKPKKTVQAPESGQIPEPENPADEQP